MLLHMLTELNKEVNTQSPLKKILGSLDYCKHLGEYDHNLTQRMKLARKRGKKYPYCGRNFKTFKRVLKKYIKFLNMNQLYDSWFVLRKLAII